MESVSRAATAESGRERVVRELRELVAALDRRAPQVERVGEVEIAHAAAALRLTALERIAELERSSDAPDADRQAGR